LTETGTDYIPTSFTASRNIEGFGYGIGLKSLLNNNLYIQVEAGIDEYDKETATFNEDGGPITYSFDPKVVTGKISIGYKF
jgi:opacity protein-like surface antigen